MPFKDKEHNKEYMKEYMRKKRAADKQEPEKLDMKITKRVTIEGSTSTHKIELVGEDLQTPRDFKDFDKMVKLYTGIVKRIGIEAACQLIYKYDDDRADDEQVEKIKTDIPSLLSEHLDIKMLQQRGGTPAW